MHYDPPDADDDGGPVAGGLGLRDVEVDVGWSGDIDEGVAAGTLDSVRRSLVSRRRWLEPAHAHHAPSNRRHGSDRTKGPQPSHNRSWEEVFEFEALEQARTPASSTFGPTDPPRRQIRYVTVQRPVVQFRRPLKGRSLGVALEGLGQTCGRNNIDRNRARRGATNLWLTGPTLAGRLSADVMTAS